MDKLSLTSQRFDSTVREAYANPPGENKIRQDGLEFFESLGELFGKHLDTRGEGSTFFSDCRSTLKLMEKNTARLPTADFILLEQTMQIFQEWRSLFCQVIDIVSSILGIFHSKNYDESFHEMVVKILSGGHTAGFDPISIPQDMPTPTKIPVHVPLSPLAWTSYLFGNMNTDNNAVIENNHDISDEKGEAQEEEDDDDDDDDVDFNEK
jgi:hypothetical protein